MCLAKTPEGAPVGLLKNLAMGARVSTGCMSHVIMTAMMNDSELLSMIETFPGSEFSYDAGGLTAIKIKVKDINTFAVPASELGAKEDSVSISAQSWPMDGFASAA